MTVEKPVVTTIFKKMWMYSLCVVGVVNVYLSLCGYRMRDFLFSWFFLFAQEIRTGGWRIGGCFELEDK